MSNQYMCIKGYDKYYDNFIIQKGEIYKEDFLIEERYIIYGLLKQNYIIPLETWREQQIDKILNNELI